MIIQNLTKKIEVKEYKNILTDSLLKKAKENIEAKTQEMANLSSKRKKVQKGGQDKCR